MFSYALAINRKTGQIALFYIYDDSTKDEVIAGMTQI